MVVDVFVGAAPPVGAELPPALPVFVLVVVEDVPVVFDEPADDDALPEELPLDPEPEPEPEPEPDPEPELELELDGLLELEELVSPVVPVGVVVPVAVDEAAEFSAVARLAEAVGSTRLGTVLGT